MSLMLFQQITGQPSVLYYATDIFQRAGFSSAAEATQADIILVRRPSARTGRRRLCCFHVGCAQSPNDRWRGRLHISCCCFPLLQGTFKLVMTGVAVLVVDKLGRRPLLLAGVSALTAALLALGALTLTGEGSNPYGCAAALLVYVGAYQLSFGPIAWLMVGEVFPADVRTAAVGAATITNFGSNFAVRGIALRDGSLSHTYGFDRVLRSVRIRAARGG